MISNSANTWLPLIGLLLVIVVIRRTLTWINSTQEKKGEEEIFQLGALRRLRIIEIILSIGVFLQLVRLNFIHFGIHGNELITAHYLAIAFENIAILLILYSIYENPFKSRK